MCRSSVIWCGPNKPTNPTPLSRRITSESPWKLLSSFRDALGHFLHFYLVKKKHLWLVSFDDIYQRFTFVDHTMSS